MEDNECMLQLISEPVNNTVGSNSLSSGLSLLLNYSSSSENSAENSPQQSQSTPSGSAFDFNLGLLAQVAVKLSPDKQKDTENTIKQSFSVQDESAVSGEQNYDGANTTSKQSHQEVVSERNFTSKESRSIDDNDSTQYDTSKIATESGLDGNKASETKSTTNENDSTAKEVTKEKGEQKLLNWLKKAEENHKNESSVSLNDAVTSTTGESTCHAVTMETRDQSQLDLPIYTEEYPAPHSFLCNGRLLRLHEPHHPGNQKAFAKRWIEGKVGLL